MRIGVTIDVPDLDRGVAFYGGAFGLAETSRPLPSLAVLSGEGGATLLLFEKPAGSLPFPGAEAPRDYGRHWTPVHVDFHVPDPEATRDRALALGATLEAWHERPGRPGAAFMADPFGHGFCVIGGG